MAEQPKRGAAHPLRQHGDTALFECGHSSHATLANTRTGQLSPSMGFCLEVECACPQFRPAGVQGQELCKHQILHHEVDLLYFCWDCGQQVPVGVPIGTRHE